MSESVAQDYTVELKFNPSKTQLADIFSNPHSSALWTTYRDSHIVSDRGLPYLNKTCRELARKIETKEIPLEKEPVRKFLENFLMELSELEYSGIYGRISGEQREWMERALPYIIGEKKINYEIQERQAN